jgi:hypothetical protein
VLEQVVVAVSGLSAAHSEVNNVQESARLKMKLKMLQLGHH